MSANYLVWVSWGVYGGASASERSAGFVSWGMMTVLPAIAATVNWLIRGFWWFNPYRGED